MKVKMFNFLLIFNIFTILLTQKSLHFVSLIKSSDKTFLLLAIESHILLIPSDVKGLSVIFYIFKYSLSLIHCANAKLPSTPIKFD